MDIKSYWQFPATDVLTALQSNVTGLSDAEASKRLAASAQKVKEKPQILKDIFLFIGQFLKAEYFTVK